MSHTQPQQHPQYPPFQQPQHQPQQVARNGLGTAALILGIIGALSGIVPILFWLAGVLGVIALILGLTGRSRAKRGEATNKGVALAGAILGLIAMGLAVFGAYTTFKAVGDAVDEINKSVSDTKAKDTKADSEADGKAGADKGDTKDKDEKPAAGKTLDAGDSVIYDDDLTVSVSNAVAFNPNEYAAGHTKGNKAYKVTVTVTNDSKAKFDATLLTADARAGKDGTTAEAIFDDKVGAGFNGTILPGKKATVVYAFDAPADAGNLTVEVTPSFEYDGTQWDLKL
ncbi:MULTISPECIES: DUF4190 domain-containing protein [unclassified Streptomyces]|uniref:DUF4190 domain-containing protein n=1 Tax=unclassified Streptomyces TaxID=2593676 RepID=UPI000DB9C855|nr:MULTISPECIES: DUF4190 domain-containing protein [unclassified Streptomyces]MYT72614.1 DUF4352 domain-containing protein [Streptomyces sp. SID8367]RAJ79471.1 uncharacterized protein DUF4352 [Streptomyces sp. PsTaAH-137]